MNRKIFKAPPVYVASDEYHSVATILRDRPGNLRPFQQLGIRGVVPRSPGPWT